MKSQIYIFTRLFNVHDRINALQLCEKIEKGIQVGEINKKYLCYLPYRDSNEKVKEKKNKTYEIFRMDCEAISHSDLLVGYLDGPVYDSGIGFELGYAYVLGKKILVMSSDYFYTCRNSEEMNSVCSLLESISTVIHIRDVDAKLEYKDGLLHLRNLLWEKMIVEINNMTARQPCFVPGNEIKYEYFIDAAFGEHEPGREVLEKIIQLLSNKDISYYVGERQDYINGENLIKSIKKCKNVIVYSDSFELNIESSIMQGIAYALNKNVILYASDRLSLYQNKDFILNKNPMIEHSANKVVSTYKEIK